MTMRTAEDLRKALDAHREAFAAQTEDGSARLRVTIALTNGLRDLPSPSKEELAELIEAQEELARLRRDRGDSNWPASLCRVGNAYVQRAQLHAGADDRMADLHLALDLYRQAVVETDEHEERMLLSFLVDLANGLFKLVEYELAAVEDIDELISVQAWLADLRRSVGDPHWPQALNVLGRAHRARSDLLDGDDEDVESYIAHFREAAAMVPVGSELRLAFAIDFANALLGLERRSESQLEEAIVIQREIARMQREADNPENAVLAAVLEGNLLLERAESRSAHSAARQRDLREAVAAYEAGYSLAPDESEHRLSVAMGLANAIGDLDPRSEKDLDRWVEVQLEILTRQRDQGHDWALAAHMLGVALTARARSLEEGSESRDSDLRSALEVMRDGLASASPEETLEIAYLSEMSNALHLLSGRSGEELDELIDVRRRLVERTRLGGGDAWWTSVNLLGDSYAERSARADEEQQRGEDLAKAITAYREAVAATPATHPEWPAFALDLASALRLLEQRSEAELDELIQIQETVLNRFQHEGVAIWPQVANTLGDAYLVRARSVPDDDADSQAVRRAVGAYREAVVGIPSESDLRPVFLRDLANALLHLPQRSQVELNELIAIQRALVDLRRQAGEPEWTESAGLLGQLYCERAKVDGGGLEPLVDDLDRALEAYRAILAAVPEDGEGRLQAMAEVANTLRLKNHRSLAEVEELVEVQSELVRLRRANDDPKWVNSSNLLGDALRERAELRGEEEARRADLDAALSAYREALDGLGADDEYRAAFAVDVANTMVLAAIAAKEGGAQTLDEAIAVVTRDSGSSSEDRALGRLLPVLRAVFRRRERWAA